MSYSKRVANAKSDKYHQNIHKRGKVFEGKEKTRGERAASAGPWLLGFFVFVLVGSAVLQIIRTASGPSLV
ncbi:g7522 [Coccomyxa viridis]|uniref:G7522 protein n=1 Tax=Coccomyxa viridis TaxID=1274662 RepID=A0ABP1FY16_9CHLO